VSVVQLDNNIRLLEEEGFKSAPETWKCRRRNNVLGSMLELISLSLSGRPLNPR